MKGFTSVLCGLLMAWVGVATCQDVEDWQNSEMIGQHKEPAHATLVPFAHAAQARQGHAQQSPFFQSLNGLWKFNWVKHPDERPRDFHQPTCDVSQWDEIPVPANWQLHGHGTP
ncbi:MAG: hypothetical protein HQ515_11095, partial [Phycisphaeraceae bacterium]|nr:hypothetical protein [Phycisphaeraceae bacterium]